MQRKNNNYVCTECKDKGVEASFWTQHLLNLHVKEFHQSMVQKSKTVVSLRDMRRKVVTQKTGD